MSESIAKKETSVKHYISLAEKILGELEGIVTLKLRELKDELAELREGFRTLKPKQTILGCKTWDEFCSKKLCRTKRAVNMLLADKPGKREETSHPAACYPANERVASCDAHGRESGDSIEVGWPAFSEEEVDPELIREALSYPPDESPGATAKPKHRQRGPERTIAEVDADNLDDATRRTVAYFKPKPIEERKRVFISWVKTIAGDLGLSIELAEIPEAFTMATDDSRISSQEVM